MGIFKMTEKEKKEKAEGKEKSDKERAARTVTKVPALEAKVGEQYFASEEKARARKPKPAICTKVDEDSRHAYLSDGKVCRDVYKAA